MKKKMNYIDYLLIFCALLSAVFCFLFGYFCAFSNVYRTPAVHFVGVAHICGGVVLLYWIRRRYWPAADDQSHE